MKILKPRAAAHRRPTLGSRRRLRGDPRGGDLERSCQGVGRRGQPAAIDEGILGWELGRLGYAGTAAPAWPGLPARGGAKNYGRMWPRWAVAPLGFRRLR